MPSQSEDEYLEAIYHLTEEGRPAHTRDIARRLGVKPPSVTEMLRKLSRDGLVEYRPYYGARLTRKGRRAGQKLTRKHRIFETFMSTVLGAPPEQAHAQACQMEHLLSDDVEHALCKMMGKPEVCADDGQPIPACDQECEACLREGVHPLSQMGENRSGVITHISTKDNAQIRRLVCMGFLPGRRVKVREALPLDGPLIVDIDDGVVAVSREYAERVFVEEA